MPAEFGRKLSWLNLHYCFFLGMLFLQQREAFRPICNCAYEILFSLLPLSNWFIVADPQMYKLCLKFNEVITGVVMLPLFCLNSMSYVFALFLVWAGLG